MLELGFGEWVWKLGEILIAGFTLFGRKFDFAHPSNARSWHRSGIEVTGCTWDHTYTGKQCVSRIQYAKPLLVAWYHDDTSIQNKFDEANNDVSSWYHCHCYICTDVTINKYQKRLDIEAKVWYNNSIGNSLFGRHHSVRLSTNTHGPYLQLDPKLGEFTWHSKIPYLLRVIRILFQKADRKARG